MPMYFMKCEETCFAVPGISSLTVALYLQLVNMKHVFTVCKLQKMHSQTVHPLKWQASLHFYYLVINQ
jgi:hypothetical protein